MSNRDDLLEGAKRCIARQGLARTTARDIAAEAGTSLAAIGYHFGGKEALLAKALMAMLGSGMGEAVAAAMRHHGNTHDALGEFGAVVDQLVSTFDAQRPGIVASVENLLQAQTRPDVAEHIRVGQREAITEIAAAFAQQTPDADPDGAEAVGALYYVLLNGLVLTWLVDTENTPDGSQLALALQTLTRSQQADPASARALTSN